MICLRDFCFGHNVLVLDTKSSLELCPNVSKTKMCPKLAEKFTRGDQTGAVCGRQHDSHACATRGDGIVEVMTLEVLDTIGHIGHSGSSRGFVSNISVCISVSKTCSQCFLEHAVHTTSRNIIHCRTSPNIK